MFVLFLTIVSAVLFIVIKFVNKYRRLALTPIDALRMRYFKGEMTRNEYEQMLKDLES